MDIGTNISNVYYGFPEWYLLDIFKASSHWVSGHTDGTWDDGRSFTFDSNGYITQLQSGQIGRKLMMRDIGAHYPGGTYIVLYEGTGTIEYGFNASKVSGAPGRDVINIASPSNDGILLNVTATNAAPNHVRNIRIVQAAYESDHATRLFHPTWEAIASEFSTIRFMDAGQINHSGQVEWSDRPQLSSASWGTDFSNGLPLEIMVAMCNKMNRHGWFCIPHKASNNYVATMAAYIAANLNANLKCYIELSNEPWNTAFQQELYFRNIGVALGLDPDQFEARTKAYSRRAREVFAIFTTEFAGQTDRLIRTVGSQAASTHFTTLALDFENLKATTDALAIAPYIGGYVHELPATTVQDWSLTDLFASLNSTGMDEINNWMNSQKSACDARGVSMIAYEGGQHLAGHFGNTTIQSLMTAANRDSRMGTLYTSMLNAWETAGGGMFCHYNLCFRYTESGRWGAMEWLDEPSTPKNNALVALSTEGFPGGEGGGNGGGNGGGGGTWSLLDSYTFLPELTISVPPADQILVPISDVSSGSWVPSEGATLWATIDETTANDADYIATSAPSSCEVALSPATDPQTSTNHVVRYRVKGNSVANLTVRLKRANGTVIASWTESAVPSIETTFQRTLSAAQADSISPTDYQNLRLEFVAS